MSILRLILLLALAAGVAGAEKYAVLVGVAKDNPSVPPDSPVLLQGPVNDVMAMRAELSRNWGFRNENITILVDARATRVNILAALDGVIDRAGAGDYVLFFFSGHGTSSEDHGIGKLMPAGAGTNSGALVSFNDTGKSRTADTLVVGKRDLRPRLARLNRDAYALVVLDSCYSGDSARSLRRTLGRGKYLPIPKSVADSISTGISQGLAQGPMTLADVEGDLTEVAAVEDDYPYTNVIAISAAKRNEVAREITRDDIKLAGRRTVDGQPHGVLTEYLLRGLSGTADANHDGVISYDELYRYARSAVQEEWAHTPHMHAPPGDMRYAPVFGSKEPFEPPVVGSTGSVADDLTRVRLVNVNPELASSIGKLEQVEVSERSPHLIVEGRDGVLKLYHSSGSYLASFGNERQQALLDRIAKDRLMRRLVGFRFAKQDFNIALDISPWNDGQFQTGDRLQFSMRAERDSAPLLLDIDSMGHVTVLYPNEGATDLHRAGSPISLDAGEVREPYGMEHLKLFAFANPPEELAHFRCRTVAAGVGSSGRVCKEFDAGDLEFRRLMALLSSAGDRAAEATIKIDTYPTDRTSVDQTHQIRTLEEAIHSNNLSDVLYYRLASAFRGAGQLNAAIAAYRESASLTQDKGVEAAAWYRQAELSQQLSRIDDAQAYVKKSLAVRRIQEAVEFDARLVRNPAPASAVIPASTIVDALKTKGLTVELTPSIDLRVQFESNRSDLTIDGARQARELCTAVESDDLRGQKVLLTGHTDKLGSDQYNLDLSRRRAQAVADYLIRTCGVRGSLISTAGRGKSELLTQGDSEQDHRLNRRVQVSLR